MKLITKNKTIKCVTGVVTVFFEDPFWVGVLEENMKTNLRGVGILDKIQNMLQSIFKIYIASAE